MEKQFCVISHTHWDREWYKSFEVFRIRLVNLIDNLLDTIKEYPDYIFHLDAQTIVLEDYFEIRPYNKELVKKYIRQGNILIGPWYVQNDFYLTSGESTIRNLQIGINMANEMGKCERVGYMPDQFGLISQLPQILNGVGVDNAIFGRGYNPNIFAPKEVRNEFEKHKPAEFLWQGPDGSNLVAINMPFWYSNAQRFSEDTNKSLKLLKLIEDKFEDIAMTPYLLLMNGVDHLEAQENLLPIIDKLNSELLSKKTVEQMTMEKYIELVKDYFNINNNRCDAENELNVLEGELRNGMDTDILHGTLSSRIYLKVLNTKAQNLLENSLEPLYSFISLMGATNEYPKDFLTYLWKLLIQNHPHDSICGCSRDEVHAHMEDRYGRLFEAGNDLLNRGMDFVMAHVNRDDMKQDEYLISVFNTLQTRKDENVEVVIEIPTSENIKGFKIFDSQGKEACFEVLSYCINHKNINSPINLPGVIEIDQYKIRLFVEKIEGFSVRTYVLKSCEEEMKQLDECKHLQSKEANVLENEFIKVDINDNGIINLTHKATGKKYEDVLVIEDSEDCGDSYKYLIENNEVIITTKNIKPTIKCLYKTELEAKYILRYTLNLPAYYDRENNRRSESLIENTVDIILSLGKGSKWVEIGFKIDNKSKDHRLRALIKSGINSDFTASMSIFDVIKRDRNNIYIAKGLQNGTVPNSGFVDINDGNEGITVLNEGIYEYHHLQGDEGIVAMTLLRANGKISIGAQGDDFKVPQNQCLRTLEMKIGLYPHEGDEIKALCPEIMKEFQNKLLSYFQPVDVKKYTGGRPAVQDSDIKEIFYRKDKYSSVQIPKESTLFKLNGLGIMQSAVKKCDIDDSLILRVVNTSDVENKFGYCFSKLIQSVHRVNLEEKTTTETRYKDNLVEDITLKPKEICTLKVVFRN